MALGVGVAAVAVAAVVVASAGGGDEPDADEALERAAAALAEEDSFRLRMTTEDRSVVGEAGGAGSESTFRVVTDVEVSGDDFRARTDAGDWFDEAVAVGGTLYARSEVDAEALAAEPWDVWPDEPLPEAEPMDQGDLVAELRAIVEDGREYDETDDMIEGTLVPTLGSYYLSGVAGPAPLTPDQQSLAVTSGLPIAFVDLFGSFTDAEVVDDSGDRLTLRASRQISEDIGFPVPAGEFEIVLDGDDRPVELRLVVEGETARHAAHVEFGGWGEDIVITTPEGEIDETPWIDEELVAEVRATVAPLAPVDVPGGYVITTVDALPSEEVEEDCDQLMLDYSPPLDDEAAYEAWLDSPDYLTVFLLPAACALSADDTPFEPGEFGDVPSRASEFGYVEVLVGDTVLQFDTTHTADLPAMVASIQPLDLDAVLAEAAAGPPGGGL